MKKHLSTIILILIFLIGLSLVLYPTVADYWNSLHQSRAIASYTQAVSTIDNTKYEEMWEAAGFEGDMTYAAWPQYDEAKTKASEVEIAVQILGKIKGRVTIPAEAEQDAVLEIVRADEKIGGLLEGKEIVKVIYVKGKLINLIIK